MSQPSFGTSVAFFTLWWMTTVVCIPALMLVLLFGRHIPRQPAVISLALSFVLSGILHSLLLLSSLFDIEHMRPSKMMCAWQSSALNGVDAMITCATLALVHTMLASIRDARLGESYKAASGTRKPMSRGFIILPYAALVAPTVVTGFTRFHDLESVTEFFAANANLPFCAPSKQLNTLLDIGMLIVNGSLVGLLVVFEVAVWITFVKARRSHEIDQDLDMAVFRRNAAVACMLTCVMGVRASRYPSRVSPIPDFALAIMATVFVVVYGSQPAVLEAVGRWLPFRRPSNDEIYVQVVEDGKY